MALRLYALRNSLSTTGITMKRGAWFNGGAPAPGLMSTDKSVEAFNGYSLRTVGTDGVVGHGFELYVGAYPLTHNMLIAGTIDVCFPSYGGSDFTWDHHWQLHAYVANQSTGGVRATLIANYQDPSGATNRLYPQLSPGPGSNSLTSPQNIATVQAYAGDYIVIELGYYQGANVGVTARANGTGARTSAGAIHADLVPGQTLIDMTNGDGAPWVEFALVQTPIPVDTSDPCCATAGPGTTDDDDLFPGQPWFASCTGGGTVPTAAAPAAGETFF